MGPVHWIFQNKILSFFTGTVLVQGYLFLGAAYFHAVGNVGGLPAYQPLKVENSQEAIDSPETVVDMQQDSLVDENSVAILSLAENLEVKRESIPAPEAPKLKPEVRGKTVKHLVGSGDNLSAIWARYGAPHAGSLLAAKAFEEASVDYRALWAGEEIQLTISPKGDIIRLQRKMKGGKTLILSGDSQSGYTPELIENKTLVEKRVVVGTIKSSLSQAAEDQQVPYQVIDQLVDIFGNRVVFTRDMQPGDEFTVIYNDRSLVDGEKLEPGPIIAASLKVNGSMMAAVQHVGADDVSRYFNENGDALDQYFLRYPVKFSRIASVFSKSRFHPVLKIKRPHYGVDFAAPLGTAVRCVADGVVEQAGWGGGSGKIVKIRHGSRWMSAYLHLSKISSGLKPGSRVTRGQLIGNVGATGLATGPHLHFALYDRGRYVDPLSAELPRQPLDQGNLISDDVLQTVMNTLEQYHQMLRVSLALGLRS